MASIKYTYSIQNDLPNSILDSDSLVESIRSSDITVAFDFIGTTGDVCDIWFKSALLAEEETSLGTLVASHTGTPVKQIETVSLSGIDVSSHEKALKVTNTKLEGSSTMKVSHNFCDKTTWYTESVEVPNEPLTVSGGSDDKIFTSAHDFWIDLDNGKVPYEHRMREEYSPVVNVDGVPQTEGYTLNYESGIVTFDESQAGAVVTAQYHYAGGSGWYLSPAAGKIMKIIGTTVKFSDDAVLDMEHSISFQLYVGGGSSAYGSPTVYNNLEDVIKCCMGKAYVVPSFSTVTRQTIALPFDYITSKDLASSIGALIKIKLANDEPMTGTFGIVTADCISVDE